MERSKDVSCQTILFTMTHMERRGLCCDGLLEGHPYDPDFLRRPRNWIDYETFCAIHARIRRILGSDINAYLDLGRFITRSGMTGIFGKVLPFVASPAQTYSLVASLFPRFVMRFVAIRYARTGLSSVRLTFELEPGYALDDWIMAVIRGQLAAVPNLFDEPDATVALTRSCAQVMELNIALSRPSLGIYRRGQRSIGELLPWVMERLQAIHSAPQELIEANLLLEDRLEALNDTREDLAETNRRLVEEAASRHRAEGERRAMEEKMLAAQKLESLGVLAGGIAHDFNNLLVSILANAELAQREGGGSPALHTHHRRITQAARRGAELCRLMLAYAGKGRMILEPVDFAEVVREADTLVCASASRKVEFHREIPETVLAVVGDTAQLRQIAVNLITNAVESMGEVSGRVTLSVDRRWLSREVLDRDYDAPTLGPGAYVTLAVCDTGCGMDEATRKRAVEPFFSTKYPGRGMGLSAVLGAVSSHGGALRIQSAPWEGTRITVILPEAASPLQDAAHPLGVVSVTRGQGTVLLVDDEREVRQVGQEILAGAGFTVLTASNGEEAFEVYRAHEAGIRCVVLDVTMPRMDGVETFRALRHLNPGLPILMTSGYPSQEIDSRLMGQGQFRFLAKPFSVSGLLEAVHGTLHPEHTSPEGAESLQS